MVTYEDLLEYCEDFIDRNNIRCETEMYTIISSRSDNIVKIDPSFEISVHELRENYAALIIIIKSALEEYRKQTEDQIHELKN